MNKINLHSVENVGYFKKSSDSDQKTKRPDPTKHFSKRLMTIRSVSDASDLIYDVNKILQGDEYLSSDEKSDLKKIRQRAYDRKKKFTTSDLTSDRSEECQTRSVPTEVRSENRQTDRLMDVLKTIDYEAIIRQVPKIILFGACAIMAMLFTWTQSIPLYESVGFPEPEFCALGAILMIAGFAAIHSVTRSKLVLILCLYASVYEVILIINGTVTHEATQIEYNIEKNQELVWLKEQAQHSNQAYQTVKIKYDDPSSNVFQNNWYKEKYINPAWENYSADQNKISQKHKELKENFGSNYNNGTLKILFRLGLVFLCMISIHHFLLIFNHQKSIS